jgi:hypothetical protein
MNNYIVFFMEDNLSRTLEVKALSCADAKIMAESIIGNDDAVIVSIDKI